MKKIANSIQTSNDIYQIWRYFSGLPTSMPSSLYKTKRSQRQHWSKLMRREHSTLPSTWLKDYIAFEKSNKVASFGGNVLLSEKDVFSHKPVFCFRLSGSWAEIRSDRGREMALASLDGLLAGRWLANNVQWCPSRRLTVHTKHQAFQQICIIG